MEPLQDVYLNTDIEIDFRPETANGESSLPYSAHTGTYSDINVYFSGEMLRISIMYLVTMPDQHTWQDFLQFLFMNLT